MIPLIVLMVADYLWDHKFTPTDERLDGFDIWVSSHYMYKILSSKNVPGDKQETEFLIGEPLRTPFTWKNH